MSSKVFMPVSSARPATAIATKDTTAPIIQAAAFSGFEVSMARRVAVSAGRGKGDSCREGDDVPTWVALSTASRIAGGGAGW